MNQTYLNPTPMLNYDAPAIQALIHTRNWDSLDEYHKIEAAYDFVQNEVLFGYNRSDLLTAEDVLQDGYGQCNTKATLLMALLRGAGHPLQAPWHRGKQVLPAGCHQCPHQRPCPGNHHPYLGGGTV